MTDFERRLTDELRSRADATTVSLDLDAIKARQPSAAPARTHSRASQAAVAVAATAAVVVVGLVALNRFRTDSAPPAATQPQASPATSLATDNPNGALPTDGPAINDHWHIAYGINVCDEWLQVNGDLEDIDAQGQLINDRFAATGIHSHDDGVIHVHPFSDAGVGPNATLGLFLDNYGIELRDDGLVFDPAAENGAIRDAYEQCDARALAPVVVVWPDIDRPDDYVIVEHSLSGISLGADRMAIAVEFADEPRTVELPPSATIDLPDGDPLPAQPDQTTSVEATP